MRILSERVHIHAPAQAVWHVLADFGNVADWAPYMRTSHLIGDIERGVGVSRGMSHAWGFKFEETVTEWNEGIGYCFDVFRAPFPMKNVRETWVAADDNGVTTLRTRVTYDMHLGLLGRIADWLLVRFIVKREMRAGLGGLKRYLESGEGRSIALQYAD